MFAPVSGSEKGRKHSRPPQPPPWILSLRHALTMSAGLDWNEETVPYTNPANHEGLTMETEDPAGFVLARPIVAEPGSHWYYNGGLPTVLGFVVSRQAQQPFGAFARERLFGPLGIADAEWAGPDAWAGLEPVLACGKGILSTLGKGGGSTFI